MPQPDLQRYRGWRRHTVGILSIVLLTLAAVLLLGEYDGTEAMASFAMRVGLVLGALWLALPQLGAIFAKFPPWLIITCLAGIAVIVVQPKLVIYLVPILGVLVVLKIFGWFTRPLAPGDSSRPSNALKKTVSGPPDSRSTRESNSDKGE